MRGRGLDPREQANFYGLKMTREEASTFTHVRFHLLTCFPYDVIKWLTWRNSWVECSQDRAWPRGRGRGTEQEVRYKTNKQRWKTARGLPGGLFSIILPSITNGTRSPCRRVWPSQTLCLLLITDMMALSSPSGLNTSSLQTLSDQVMFKTFPQTHISQLSSLRSSNIKCNLRD